MQRVLISLVSVLSFLQIGCGIELERPSDEEIVASQSLATVADGIYISSKLCEDSKYETADEASLYFEIGGDNIDPELSVVRINDVVSGLKSEIMVIDRKQIDGNISLAKKAYAAQLKTLEESSAFCESGVEILESSNLLRIVNGGHIINQYHNFGHALSLRPVNYKYYRMTLYTSLYKCVDSQVVKTEDLVDEYDLIRLDDGIEPSVENIRAEYANYCSN